MEEFWTRVAMALVAVAMSLVALVMVRTQASLVAKEEEHKRELLQSLRSLKEELKKGENDDNR